MDKVSSIIEQLEKKKEESTYSPKSVNDLYRHSIDEAIEVVTGYKTSSYYSTCVCQNTIEDNWNYCPNCGRKIVRG